MLLRRHGVEKVVDVRSSPYSRYTSQFNQDVLNETLNGIGYSFLGAELGGRPPDRSCYDADGRVMYDRLASTDLFGDGIRRVMHDSRDHRIALMCSEKEPLHCHRALLIGSKLTECGARVEHILPDGSLEDHDTAMERLMDSFKLPHNGDMFRSRNEVIAEALDRQAKKIAYVGRWFATDDSQYGSTF